LLFNPELEGDIFFPNICGVSADFRELYSRI
jgi:hypothetical protein